jgi:hypothetical protein
MRKALTLLIALLCVNLALAQNTPLACQVDAAAGLSWENGQWKTTRFFEKKFILVLSGDTLTKESAAQALGTLNAYTVSCNTDLNDKMISCIDRAGRSLVFMPETRKGGVSKLFGATMNSKESRDSVQVSAFTCQPY